MLFLGYVVNAMDRGVLSILLEPIKLTFHASDTELGLLGGLAFALFYSTLGIPIAMLADRTSRRNVLAACVALWSVMTALCGMATTFLALLLARTGTGVGEAGGSPPSHALIADYFPISKRATAFSVYALAIPAGAMLGSFFGGWFNELYGWRATFILIGLPGVLVALLVRFTVKEPPRGYADRLAANLEPQAAGAKVAVPPFWDVVRFFNRRPSFWHLCLAAALHSVVWYGGSTFNAVFFIRSHHMSTGEAGSWLALMAAIAGIGTFLGGYLGDRLSVRTGDRRWYLWVPAVGALLMVPLQFLTYLAG
ncbi:MAG: spinster family MFS transporter, partial [Sciscionella sp.]